MVLELQQRTTQFGNWRGAPKTAATSSLTSTNNCFGAWGGGLYPPAHQPLYGTTVYARYKIPLDLQNARNPSTSGL